MPFDGTKTLADDQLDRLASVTMLQAGSHATKQQLMCVMEAVAYVAGEEWSDRPVCACPIITRAAIRLNDSILSNVVRDQLLRPLIPLLIGTRSTPAVERRRADLVMAALESPQREYLYRTYPWTFGGNDSLGKANIGTSYFASYSGGASRLYQLILDMIAIKEDSDAV